MRKDQIRRNFLILNDFINCSCIINSFIIKLSKVINLIQRILAKQSQIIIWLKVFNKRVQQIKSKDGIYIAKMSTLMSKSDCFLVLDWPLVSSKLTTGQAAINNPRIAFPHLLFLSLQRYDWLEVVKSNCF